MIRIRAFLISAFILNVLPVHGQQNDFQSWPTLQLNVEFLKNIKFHVSEEVRLRENSTLFSKQINDAGFSYKINSYIKAGIFYRIEADWKNADDYEWQNGFYGDLSFKYPVKRFTIGYRFRGLSAKADLGNQETAFFSGFRHRHKISLEYNIKGIRLNPYGEFEVFAKTGGNASGLTDYRAWVGLEYKLKKNHSFYLQYGLNKELNTPDPLTSYILSGGYTLDISTVKSDR